MSWIENITKENFTKSFNLKEILNNSVFYPASGIDGRAIEGLSLFSNSFIHVDYSIPRETVETALRTHFECAGYNLIGLKFVSENELTPNGFDPHNFPLQVSEKERMHFLQDSVRNFKPFALWAVYQLDTTKYKPGTAGRANRFSILHIGGEACATFDALYVGNKINPLAVAILNPGEGYGDNWTIFRDPDYRLYRLIEYNCRNHQEKMPRYIFSNICLANNCFWPDYKHLERNMILACDIFQYNDE